MMTQPQTKKEIFQVKASRDPVSGAIGTSMGYDLSAQAKKIPVHYSGKHGEWWLTLDAYKLEGQPLYLIAFCPVCQNSIKISEDNKSMQLDLELMPRFSGFRTEEILAGLNLQSLGGLLSIEPFGCTWEAEPDLRRQHFAVCPWRVSITNNIARDA